MSLDIQSIQIKPKRETFGHVARRIGEGKPASRYEEVTFDIQSTSNFHYLPTYNSKFELYDERKTAIQMEDWYKFLDPRQFYYSSYVSTRAKQQESVAQNIAYIEKRNLVNLVSSDLKQLFFNAVMPLRHYEWGANMNNLQLTSESYGSAFASAAMFHAEDRLGNAQFLTKIALLFSENELTQLEAGKDLWLNDAHWQGLRKVMEDSFVIEDWFELHILQNVLMDAFVHDLFFRAFEQEIKFEGAGTYSLMTGFIADWFEESAKWVDSTLKVAAAESEANKETLTNWVKQYIDVVHKAVTPLAEQLVADPNDTLLEIRKNLTDRLEKSGIHIK